MEVIPPEALELLKNDILTNYTRVGSSRNNDRDLPKGNQMLVLVITCQMSIIISQKRIGREGVYC